MFDFSISTKGLDLDERYVLVEKVGLVPVGTECFRAGDFTESTTKIVVSKDNQKEVTMFWNSLYFLDFDEAERETIKAHAEYGAWQAQCMGY